MTVDINEHFGVTMTITRHRGPALAEGTVFLRSDPGLWWMKVNGEGRVVSTALTRATTAARSWVQEHGDDVLRERGVLPHR